MSGEEKEEKGEQNQESTPKVEETKPECDVPTAPTIVVNYREEYNQLETDIKSGFVTFSLRFQQKLELIYFKYRFT